MDDFVSRKYQVKLEEIATKKNTIIHLPTGSGKTYIACSVIKRLGAELLKPWGEGGKRTFFLVNTVPLVNQQRQYIECMVPVKGVAGYSSEDGIDYWKKDKWDIELAKNQVIVMTSQILCDMLTHSYIKVENINLIIFDECHHAVDYHPMRLIMKHFEQCPIPLQPRIVGLTATLLNANVTLNQVENSLRDLETTFQATIATVNELGEVLTYSTNPIEMVEYYPKGSLSRVGQEVIIKLNALQTLIMDVRLPDVRRKQDLVLNSGQFDISSDPKKIVKAVKNMVGSVITFLEDMGSFGGEMATLAYIILLERLKRKASTKEEGMLYKFTITHLTQARLMLFKSMEKDTGYDRIVKNSSPKILQLLKILKEYNPRFIKSGHLFKTNHSLKPLCAIIFTQQRFTAKILYNILKEVKKENPSEFGFLKHDFIVGFSGNPFKNTREQHYIKKESQRALLMFKNDDLNCLISTSVVEEGVDIPNCSLVLRYDRPLEYRSYIQSKGRARSKDSTYVIMVDTQDRANFEKHYVNFQRIENLIQGILVGSTDDRDAPTFDDIQKELYEDPNDIPPYIPPKGAPLCAAASISLLNRYISMLPHDNFTVLTPAWVAEKVQHELQLVTIMLPAACPIKEPIKGEPQKSLKQAKRSAALNACIKLHKEGQLDEVTMLPSKYASVDFDEIAVKDCFPNWPWDDKLEEDSIDAPKPGTKKYVRKHKICFPKSLSATSSDKYYLHIIKLSVKFAEPKESREHALFEFLKSESGFGFLTQHPLPKLCAFPAFLSVGEVTVDIEMNYAVIKLNSKLFELAKRFHLFIFDQVLNVAKQFLIFEGKVNCMYVVPLKKGNDGGPEIDWETMVTHKTIKPANMPSLSERRNIKVTNEEYLHKVVTPWYRGSILPDRYIVSKVLEHLSPESQFESDSFVTFASYYSSKYNLEIMGNKNQQLLEVRHISSRMNCLLPRAVTIRSFTEKQKKLVAASQSDNNAKGFPELFVAEFCIKHDFPGDLWFKAMILPSILHRVRMLLTAQELIAEIAKDIHYGSATLPRTEEWLPVPVNMSIAVMSLLSQIEEPKVPTIILDRGADELTSEAKTAPFKSLKDTLYKLQKKKINKEYPWEEQSEPIDIERNILSATVMDIECYDEFVSTPMEVPQRVKSVTSPPRDVMSNVAIKPPPLKFNDKLSILSKNLKNRGPELRDVLSALTTIKSHETFSLERAETLGDSFLKYASTVYLYHKFPQRNEGQLTNIKGRLISNRNLYYAGERFNLGGRMKVEQFSPRKDFMLPAFFVPKKIADFIQKQEIRPTFLIGVQFSREEALSGELKPETYETVVSRFFNGEGIAEEEPVGKAQNAMQCYLHLQAVSDKSVADSVEALIGTYLNSGGILAAIKIVEWMRIIPAADDLASLLRKKVPTVITNGKAEPKDIQYLLDGYQGSIEEILNYKFKDPSYLLEAMSHSSYIRNRLTRSYERMEFLGDAILDFLITIHIYENSPNLEPGDITNLRSALVNNVTFASYVVKLGLHKYLCKDFNPVLDNAIAEFVQHQISRDHDIEEDVLYMIDEEDCQCAAYIDVPKVLSDIFEALTGAIYLDCGGDLQTVWSVIYPIMCNEIYKFSQRIPRQPVAVLYEKIHAAVQFERHSTNEETSKVIVPVTFTKEGVRFRVYGVGTNKSQAKRAAAKVALKILDSTDDS